MPTDEVSAAAIGTPQQAPPPAAAPAGSAVATPVVPAKRPAAFRRWTYAAAGRRDLRLDFLRGFCAFAMVVDHLGGASFLYPFTGGNRFFVSAAEGFIFLSGLLVGLIYGPRILRDGLTVVQLHLLRRALTLYGVTLGLTFTFVGLSRLADMPWLQDVERLTPPLVVSILTLHYTYYLVDVMLFYTLMLAIAPLGLLLLHTGHTAVVVGLSVGLWALYQWFPEAAQVPWTIVNNQTFNVPAWQLWFYGGMVIGYHRNWVWKRASRLPRIPAVALLVTAAVGLIALRLTDGAPLAGIAGTPDGPAAIELLFGKESARPGRVLAFAVFFPLFYLTLTYVWRPLERASGWLMIPFGANALYVYAVHLFAVYLSALFLPYVPGFDRFDPVQNTAVQIAAVLAIWLMVKRELLFDVIPR
ncbi:MAG: OpgC domain-containing protein [Chloroflexi bacterium]|nr:OpgC domain-containing protein [Chloroflexota bacterium]